MSREMGLQNGQREYVQGLGWDTKMDQEKKKEEGYHAKAGCILGERR